MQRGRAGCACYIQGPGNKSVYPAVRRRRLRLKSEGGWGLDGEGPCRPQSGIWTYFMRICKICESTGHSNSEFLCFVDSQIPIYIQKAYLFLSHHASTMLFFLFQLFANLTLNSKKVIEPCFLFLSFPFSPFLFFPFLPPPLPFFFSFEKQYLSYLPQRPVQQPDGSMNSLMTPDLHCSSLSCHAADQKAVRPNFGFGFQKLSKYHFRSINVFHIP